MFIMLAHASRHAHSHGEAVFAVVSMLVVFTGYALFCRKGSN